MELEDFHDLVDGRIGGSVEIDAEDGVHAVLLALATRLTPEEADDLGAELPEPLGDLLASAAGQHAFDRDAFLEDVAARLDLDDVDAERVALAVLGAIRAALEAAPFERSERHPAGSREPSVAVEQVIESMPSDLAKLMHSFD